MLILISSSKTQDFTKQSNIKSCTFSVFLNESQKLIELLKKIKRAQLVKILKISDNLYKPIKDKINFWNISHPENKSKAAVLAFKGEAYKNINAAKFTSTDFEFISKHLRILSGLYGLLRPVDYIMPHRLEMKTSIENEFGNNLYKFWSKKITSEINKICKENEIKTIINLASKEYFKVIDKKKLNLKTINIVFLQNKKGILVSSGILSKQARGLMVNYIVKNRITDYKELKQFNLNGYSFQNSFSSEKEFVYAK